MTEADRHLRHVGLVKSNFVPPERALLATPPSPLELQWLPVLGPTALMVWRYLYMQVHLMERPAVLLWEVAVDCGLPGIQAVRNALNRLESFGVVRLMPGGKGENPKMVISSWLERPSPGRQAKVQERAEEFQDDHYQWVNQKGQYA